MSNILTIATDNIPVNLYQFMFTPPGSFVNSQCVYLPVFCFPNVPTK